MWTGLFVEALLPWCEDEVCRSPALLACCKNIFASLQPAARRTRALLLAQRRLQRICREASRALEARQSIAARHLAAARIAKREATMILVTLRLWGGGRSAFQTGRAGLVPEPDKKAPLRAQSLREPWLRRYRCAFNVYCMFAIVSSSRTGAGQDSGHRGRCGP